MSDTTPTAAAPAAAPTPAPVTYARLDLFKVVDVQTTSTDPRPSAAAETTWIDATGLAVQPLVGYVYNPITHTFEAPHDYVPPAGTRLTPLEFIQRLTPAEDAAIAAAGQSNTQVLLWLLKCSAATYVDLTDPQTIAGVQALGTAGLLTADRVTAILSP